MEKKYGRKVKSLELRFDGDWVEIVGGEFEPAPFERIRRITGYLVSGDTSHWVASKQAEEKARVKHTMEEKA